MRDERDYKIELSTTPVPSRPAPPPVRPYISVLFECCSVYLRVYRDPDGRRYSARCPRCGTSASFTVGSGGTACRAFRVR